MRKIPQDGIFARKELKPKSYARITHCSYIYHHLTVNICMFGRFFPPLPRCKNVMGKRKSNLRDKGREIFGIKEESFATVQRLLSPAYKIFTKLMAKLPNMDSLEVRKYICFILVNRYCGKSLPIESFLSFHSLIQYDFTAKLPSCQRKIATVKVHFLTEGCVCNSLSVHTYRRLNIVS